MQASNLPISKFKLEPYAWQREAIFRAFMQDDFAFLAEMGTGKTCALINTLRCRYADRQRIQKTLILSPLVTLNNWKNEFKIHSFVNSSNVVVLKGTSKQKVKKFKEVSAKSRIFITNYESIINKELFELLFNYDFEILVLDEAHYVKSHKSKRSKAVCSIADKCRHRYLMTGTPILNDVSDLFMQYRILDGGKTFGKVFYTFQNKYMMDMNESWKGRGNYFPKWVTNPSKYAELNDKMYKKAIRVLKKDCLDLPPLIKKTIAVPMGPSQKKAYLEMERDFVTFIKDSKTQTDKAVVAELALTKALKLQQITTGFMTDEDGKVHEFDKIPRLDQLKELIVQLHKEHKIIVWCSFIHNYKMVEKLCKEMKLQYGLITGAQSLDEKTKYLAEFDTNPDMRIMIANRRAGGIGVNMVAASYSIVYSRNFSLSEELQSEARNHRGGSEIHEKITKIDLIAENTLELNVLQSLQNKQTISDNIVDMVTDKR